MPLKTILQIMLQWKANQMNSIGSKGPFHQYNDYDHPFTNLLWEAVHISKYIVFISGYFIELFIVVQYKKIILE